MDGLDGRQLATPNTRISPNDPTNGQARRGHAAYVRVPGASTSAAPVTHPRLPALYQRIRASPCCIPAAACTCMPGAARAPPPTNPVLRWRAASRCQHTCLPLAAPRGNLTLPSGTWTRRSRAWGVGQMVCRWQPAFTLPWVHCGVHLFSPACTHERCATHARTTGNALRAKTLIFAPLCGIHRFLPFAMLPLHCAAGSNLYSPRFNCFSRATVWTA